MHATDWRPAAFELSGQDLGDVGVHADEKWATGLWIDQKLEHGPGADRFRPDPAQVQIDAAFIQLSPGATPLHRASLLSIEVGSRINVGQTVGILEVMKLMNVLELEVGGEVLLIPFEIAAIGAVLLDSCVTKLLFCGGFLILENSNPSL